LDERKGFNEWPKINGTNALIGPIRRTVVG
jgi:hypothetical protein